MKKIILYLSAFLFPIVTMAESVFTGIDEKINSFFEPITTAIEAVVFFTVNLGGDDIPFVLIWLIVGAFVFTVGCDL